jgi:hypothetical protein
MSDWRIENYGPNMNSVTKWAAANPLHAAEFTLAHQSGYVSQLTIETIGKEWAKIDPPGALQFAATKTGQLTSELATGVLKAWAEQDLQAAADWLAGADERTRNRLSPSFVEAWAKQDAASALTWCEENLTGSSLTEAVGGLVKGTAAKDIAAAAALVSQMDPSPARAEGAAAVAQKWFPDFSSDTRVKPETIAWLGSLDPISIKRVLNQVQWSWSTSDPQSLATFLVSASPDAIPPFSYSNLAQQMARQNPAEALDWARHLPGDRALSAGGDAFAEWRRSQPDAAMAWLNNLAPTDPRRERFFQSAIQALAFEPQAVDQLSAMSTSQRAAARTVIETMGLPDDRRTQLLEALSTH